MPEYDCIIPWSGGVESTAVVNWAVNNNKTPLCVHNRMMPAEWESVQNMSKILDVDVFKYQQVSEIPVDSKSRNFYSKKFNLNTPKWTPVIHNWVYSSIHANLRWPKINKIYFGHCGAGAVEKDDNLGDEMHDGAVTIFTVWEQYLKAYGIETEFVPPLDHLTKREQWLSLPKKIKKEIFTCQKVEANIKRSNCKSYSCSKCDELMRAVPNAELHLIK
jgi:formylmethanofuran dehydrogenase subunit E